MDGRRVVIKFILVRSRPDVSPLVKISSKFAVYRADHDVMADVELSSLVKKWSV